MSEASFWDYLRKVLPPTGHYSRIESETAQGFPDIHYTIDGRSGTIELKSAHTKRDTPFSGGDEGLRRSQIIWMDEEDRAGGRVWIFAEVFSTIYVISGNTYRDDFNGLTLEQLNRLSDLVWVKGLNTGGKVIPAKLRGLLTEPL